MRHDEFETYFCSTHTTGELAVIRVRIGETFVLVDIDGEPWPLPYIAHADAVYIASLIDLYDGSTQ